MKLKSLSTAVPLALLLFLPVAAGLAQSFQKAIYHGRTVEQWFQEYVAGAGTRTPPTAPAMRNGEFMPGPPDPGKSDAAWEAFRALGALAVPYLIQHLPLRTSDPKIVRVAKTAPAFQSESPDPERKQLERRQAIELIHRLGVSARAAAPALLGLLKQAGEPDAEELCAALRSIRAEPGAINEFLLSLGRQDRNAEVLRYARRLGWNGSKVARLLGKLLRASDPELCHGAILLLEAAGPGARPAAEQIVATLENPDQEVRYLAARCLAQVATNTPVAAKALRSLANDGNNMVRKVARQKLGQLPPR